jgi:hypothetical protein
MMPATSTSCSRSQWQVESSKKLDASTDGSKFGNRTTPIVA